MKKNYMTPTIMVTEIDMREQLLTISGGDTGLGYGGVDTEGELEPASREFDDLFDNDLPFFMK